MATIATGNDVESVPNGQDQLKLVKRSLFVALETQAPNFENSLKVKQDSKRHLQRARSRSIYINLKKAMSGSTCREQCKGRPTGSKVRVNLYLTLHVLDLPLL